MSEDYPARAKIPRSEIEHARRHLFVCLGPDCCDATSSAPLWDYLKARCRSLKVPVLRTKAACLRVCSGGPWLVVYPEGAWYGGLTEERLERILVEHVEEGLPVAEWVAAVEKFPCGDSLPGLACEK